MLRTRHQAALAIGLHGPSIGTARHWLDAFEPQRAREAAIDAAAVASERHAPADELAALELALAVHEAYTPASGGFAESQNAGRDRALSFQSGRACRAAVLRIGSRHERPPI